MKKSNLAVTAAVTGLLAIAGTTLTATSAVAAEKEKCYGVAKAGKNDCATKTSSCAGTSKEDFQKDAFIVVPKGLCDRLAGGSNTSS
ncbi:conserved hypothetical protein [Vibrio nigripulchritudo MADA3029]|uniref:Uncharacterized protein n=2 Tax=Vibrio nigripulchritudo TaxID=28173 RepID=U4K3E6_9VIBR|nr:MULTISPECIES: DUF2282 domain-containing protein [Vibrio]EGU54589.1 putative signal peptide protein [Vibrio nigripulchritudo ATCC 27043]KJY69580.1 membrane protein [Vibrio nigripulchritudo]UAB70409.1 DUF2282 domain-containing protein [Vibrio sp. SCSIO 43132]CCN38100.1 conserved hypothetical protein [Vibrio nigripulchritudo AM115]CCN43969.1 conserved hypothetical protein [Vibrio nigripulchritudo FTn2]